MAEPDLSASQGIQAKTRPCHTKSSTIHLTTYKDVPVSRKLPYVASAWAPIDDTSRRVGQAVEGCKVGALRDVAGWGDVSMSMFRQERGPRAQR